MNENIELTLDPSTVVFPEGKQVAIARLGSKEVIRVDDFRIAKAFIDIFSCPKSVKQAQEQIDAVDEPVFNTLINAGVQVGVLCEAGHVSKDILDSSRSGTAMLKMISRLTEQLSSDINTMGPYVNRYTEETHEGSLHGSLRKILAEMTEVQLSLTAHRTEFIDSQLNEMDRKTKKPWLHLGCGASHLQEWINIDIYPAELSLNLCWGLPFHNDEIEYVFLSHLFEHLYKKIEAPGLLKEIYRVLKPGGVVRIIVPDARRYLEAYVNGDEAFFDTQKQVWSRWAPKARTHLHAVLSYLGAREDPRNFAQHKYAYDYETLADMLSQVGFSQVIRSNYMESVYEDLRVDHMSTVAHAEVNGEYFSLFIEATK